ncbi:hypothetical protein DR871_008820 [Flavobacterium petrolei]|jgi:putative redox protein|uniref:Uncharacterized protein n=1 Tax=Flavobacterium petrolei TaxID=2259594 RepID=A0A482TLD2_9FLAO|nr:MULTISPECIES: hypothetical protein [Flavobacterium]MDD2819701.1 hypothetical protein [Flavobacterium sp.]QIH37782.1 hypothetical protein G7A72_02740 [Flavobacterium sp. Sr18]RYJ52318.1 hypothetical protein DR871_008820 [Flavobacterium petrolei]
MTANIGAELYKTEKESETNLIISDEPDGADKKDLGFTPKELLASSLSTLAQQSLCACMRTEKAGI